MFALTIIENKPTTTTTSVEFENVMKSTTKKKKISNSESKQQLELDNSHCHSRYCTSLQNSMYQSWNCTKLVLFFIVLAIEMILDYKIKKFVFSIDILSLNMPISMHIFFEQHLLKTTVPMQILAFPMMARHLLKIWMLFYVSLGRLVYKLFYHLHEMVQPRVPKNSFKLRAGLALEWSLCFIFNSVKTI